MRLQSLKTTVDSLRLRRAFTMIEIAISIAIIAVGLIAIAGVLPAGLNVQRDNREDTIIQEDGAYLLEAICAGGIGFHEITNHVLSVTVSNNFSGNLISDTRDDLLPDDWTPTRVLGLMTTPKMWPMGHPNYQQNSTNTVLAVVKAFTGSAIEQSGGQDEFAFRYLADISVTPYKSPYTYIPPSGPTLGEELLNIGTIDAVNEFNRNIHLERNLWLVSVKIMWPLRGVAGGNVQVGGREQTFSRVVAGKIERAGRRPWYFLTPETFRPE